VPGVQNGSGTLTGPNYQGSLSGIDLGEYTLTVDDGQGFSREIEFAVFLVSMDEGGLLKDEQGKIVRIATRFEEPWSGIDIEDSAAIINFNVTPDEENEGDFGYVIDVVDDPNHTDVGFVDPSTWGNQDHAVTYYAPEEKKNDLRPFTGHVGVANASFFIGAFHGEERNEFDLISREHQRTGVWVDSNFVFIADVQEDKETAIDFILQKYDWVDLTPIDGRDNISYEPDGSGYGMAFYYTKRIELYDAAFNAENYCASTIIHELNHIEEGTWYSGGGPEEKAYATEYENAYRTGVTKDWIDINWEEQMGNTNYPDEGYQGYEDDD